MSTITPFLQEVVYIVADFLQSIQHKKQAQKLKKQYQIPEWVRKDNPLIKKGLKKILKDYINQKEKVLKFFQNRKPQEQDGQQSQEQSIQEPKPIKKTKKTISPKMSPLTKPKSPKVQVKKGPQPLPSKGWMANQFQQPKRLQDLNYDKEVIQQQQPQVVIPKSKKQKLSKKVTKKQTSSQQQSQQSTPKQKKHKKQIKKQKKQKKVKGPVDTSYLNSDDQFQLQDKKAKKSITPQKKSVQKVQTKKIVVTRKRSASIQQEVVQQKVKKVETIVKNHVAKRTIQTNEEGQEEQQQNNYNVNNNNDGFPKQFFSRINKNEVGFIPQNRRDNTFEAKQRYGDAAGDTWGQYGHQKLKDTRGDSFKKTKGKLKNKAFQGAGINMNQINSVPIL